MPPLPARRFKKQLADDLNTTVEELDAVEEYPMLDPLDDDPGDE